ncbi:caspase family protein [Pseudorhodoplanes sp.]|uniref:caspase family protein n=1 Tax=Pseudorhodoplanes sp. TaxID=1934341 RepID=UPI003D0CBD4A
MRPIITLLAAFVSWFAVAMPGAVAQDRVALVIGNDRYPNLPAEQQLVKAVNDARAVASTLESIGFKVMRGENLDRTRMVEHIFRFVQAIKPGDTALLFFAGHGVSIAGGNYLMPTDVPEMRPGEEGRARNLALGETDIVGDIQAAKPRVMVMILDACRDNPFRQAGLTRSLGTRTGLARGAEAEGVFTIYSAGFGQAALDRLDDNDRSPNSVFTRALLPALARTDTHLADIVIDMREQVAKLAATIGHQQYPAYYDQTRGGRVYLAARPPAGGAESGARIPGPVQPQPAAPVARRTALLIGNSEYPNHVDLVTPSNDVEAVARMLRDAGFDRVVSRNNLTRAGMRVALRDFAGSAASAEVAMVFYSGHATRVAADRLLLGSDFRSKALTVASILQQGVNLSELIDATKGAARRIVVIDSDQKEAFKESAPAKPGADALDPRGAVVIYSSGATESASDGSGIQSPFTEAFVRHFKVPGASLREAFAKVQRDVSAATKRQQNPAIYGAAQAQFSLVSP